LLEWQAGLNILRDRPLFGVAAGNYRREIGHYYFTAPKLNTMEPDSQSGYLVTLFTTGLAGLAAFAWVLLRAFGHAARNVNGAPDPFLKWLSLGAMGGMIAFSINNMFAPLIYQSTAVQFIVMLCIIDASERLSSGTNGAPPVGGR
jgi:O-antigen ligase